MAITPYVVGQWVRKERFYGRRDLLDEILDGNRNCLWILGTRRIGKTSILKQLEHRAVAAASPRWFPLFWDFQGAESVEDLVDGFRDALLDAADRLEGLGIDLDEVDSDDLFASLSRVRRELRSRGLALLLLGDEVEELVGIRDREPRFLRRLRRVLQSPEGIRTVFASTIRLWRLAAEEATTSPFLHGFTPALPVRGLSDDEARALIRQRQLPAAVRPSLDETAVEVIRDRCNNHPYLLQLLSERYLELGDLEHAVHEIESDEMVSFFFASDLAMLGASERRILALVHELGQVHGDEIERRLADGSTARSAALQRLELLGFVSRSAAGDVSLTNYFFRQWFAKLSHGGPEAASGEGDSASASTARTVASAREPSRRFDGRYELLTHLGHGSSGEVYKAHDSLLDTVVALKILRRELSADDEAIQRLRREVVLARDVSHPNLLKIYHLGDDDGQRYITMQFIDGPDLAQVIAGQAPLPAERAVAIAGKLATALSALHGSGILHRDIKPSNVLIDEAGEPRITDFGLVRHQAGPAVTQNGFFLGTPRYASPEQVMGEPLDERSDLYALGLILFEMVTGRPPWEGDTIQDIFRRRLGEKPPSPAELVPSVTRALSAVVLRCLERDPARRYQDGDELARALAAPALLHSRADERPDRQ